MFDCNEEISLGNKVIAIRRKTDILKELEQKSYSWEPPNNHISRNTVTAWQDTESLLHGQLWNQIWAIYTINLQGSPLDANNLYALFCQTTTEQMIVMTWNYIVRDISIFIFLTWSLKKIQNIWNQKEKKVLCPETRFTRGGP